MLIKEIDPRRAVVIADLENGTVFTYTMHDLNQEEHVPVLAMAMAFATLELKRVEAEWQAWQAEQFVSLQQPRPADQDGKRPKKMSEKMAEAAVKTSDAFMRMRGDVGRAAAAANMLEVMAALVSAGRFQRKDRSHRSAAGRG